MTAASDTPRVARWLWDRLRAEFGPSRPTALQLPVFRGARTGDNRAVLYSRQGGVDISNLQDTYMVRSVWVVYLSHPVAVGRSVTLESMEADADRMHDAIHKPQEPTVVSGRLIQECRRDPEHYQEVYDGNALKEVQLGGVYVILSSLE